MNKLLLVTLGGAMSVLGCKKEELRVKDASYKPDIRVENFINSTNINNSYYPLQEGKVYVFEGNTEDGKEHIEVQRTNQTKTIMGITCLIQNDKVYLNDILIEDTDDWVAQDNNGNLWYFGETVKNYDSKGKFKDNAGSWEAGIDGAQPGLWMPTKPVVGMSYRQEYYFNEAEDEAEVVEVGITVTIAYGTFNDCIKTKDFTKLELDVFEYKYYAPGIGLLKEEKVENNKLIEVIELVEIR